MDHSVAPVAERVGGRSHGSILNGNYAPNRLSSAWKPTYGLLAPDGAWKFEPRYTAVNRLWDGRAVVCISEGEETGRRPVSVQCGSIDENGNQALPMVPYKVVGYRNGVYKFFGDKRRIGLLNEAGELIGGRLFDKVNFTEPGSVLEVREHGEWIGLTLQGETVQNRPTRKFCCLAPQV